MLGDSFLKRVLPIFEHLDHQLKLLVQLGDRVFLLLLQLFFNFLDVLFEHFRLLDADFDFVLECDLLANQWIDLIRFLLRLVADLMALTLVDDTFRANVLLAGLAQVFRLLLWMQEAKALDLVTLFLIWPLVLLCLVGWRVSMDGRADATERVCILFIINVVKDREVAD